MMYKVIVQEEREEELKIYFETVHELSTQDKVVLANSLRAIANQYDPPRTLQR